MSIAVRSGTCHRPSPSIRNPSRSASNNSVTSRTCLTSSRDSINMALFSLSFLLLNPFNYARCDIRFGINQHDIDTLKRIDDEIRYQAELVILPFPRLNFERLLQKSVNVGWERFC